MTQGFFIQTFGVAGAMWSAVVAKELRDAGRGALASSNALARRAARYDFIVWGACVVLACALALVEITDFLTPTRAKTHGVDDARNATLRMEIDVTFPRMPCQLLYVDAYDESGKHEVDARGLLLKTRLDASGRAIGEYESAGGVDLGGLVLFQRRPEHAHEVREAHHAHEKLLRVDVRRHLLLDDPFAARDAAPRAPAAAARARRPCARRAP